MWDSFHSIWEYAMKDPDCNCTVMPITYYELNSKREVEKVVYEGDKFDENIKIPHYSEYNIEKIQPDVIYIHSPYDGYNKLTLIDPKYFSENLKKYTNMLVYLPYFIAGSYKSIGTETMTYTCPGYKNADKIVAQSYVQGDVLKSIGYSDEKILRLGSPKIDFVVNNLKNKHTHPKIDGKKKVILLSTGINDLLAIPDWIDNLIDLIKIHHFTIKLTDFVLRSKVINSILYSHNIFY